MKHIILTTMALVITATLAQASEPTIYAEGCPAYVQEQIDKAKAEGGSVLHIAATLKELSDEVKYKSPDEPKLILIRTFEKENRLMAFCSDRATFPLIVSGRQ